ncbi:MAG: ABC transporter ATP-binding protein [Bdellovibrionota bacterium]
MSIHLQNIVKAFGEPPVKVLHEITLEIQDGECITLTGRSGSGKSTLLYILSTLDIPTSGEIVLGGKRVAQMGSEEVHRFRNLYMGFVFQFHYLLSELSALENVLMPTLKSRQRDKYLEPAQDLLKQFGLGDKMNRLPGQLSGGEQQRVAIARALVMEPRYLFADEPTGNLDSASGDRVMDILMEINRTKKTTMIYVTHDKEYAALAKRRIHLVDGRVASAD